MTGHNRPPRPRKPRADGWTKNKITVFLETLALGANVTQAAKAAGKGRATAYTFRRRDAAFAAAWDEALEQAVDELFWMMLDRAKHGSLRTETRAGETVKTIHSFSDRLGASMLGRYRPTLRRASSGPRPAPIAPREEIDVCDAIGRILHRAPE